MAGLAAGAATAPATCSMLCMVSRPLLERGMAAAAAAAAARASGVMSCSIACASNPNIC